MYNVVIKRKMLRNLRKIPEQIQKKMGNLVEDLRDKGPIRNDWISDRDDETMDIFATDWYRDIKAKIRPGDNLKIYRQNHDMTQAELGQKLGDIPRQHISNMERGIRTISLKNARKLAILFGVSPEKFI